MDSVHHVAATLFNITLATLLMQDVRLSLRGTFPNNHEVVKALNVPLLTAEKTINISGGFTSTILKNVSLTVDAYWIQIKDRIVLSGTFVRIPGDSLDKILDNIPNFDVISRVAFFTNAINTRTKGIDIVLDGNWNSKSKVWE